MKKDNFEATLLALLLIPPASALLSGCSGFLESTRVRAGVQYREFGKSPELEKLLDEERDALEPAMPGTSEVMQVGDQLPVLTVDIAVSPNLHLLSKDDLEGSLTLGYSTSGIFGGAERSKDIHASLYGLDFGKTPTTFAQSLNHYLNLGLGAKYSPIRFSFGNFGVKMHLGGEAGMSYVNSDSVFEFKVLDPTLFEATPQNRQMMHSMDIHQRSETKAKSTGLGKYASAQAGLEFEYKSVSLLLEFLKRYEIVPELVIRRTRTLDPDRMGIYPKKEQVIPREDTVEYFLSSTGITAEFQYEFK